MVPGTLDTLAGPEAVLEFAKEHGYPVAIKAVGGGGGRGLRVVRAPAEAASAFESASREAASAFKNPDLYVETYLEDPRHIEIQVLADGHGHAIALGERDCSVQRRHQKLIEESPSPAITPALRAQMGADAVALTRAVGYVSAGTLEFLFQDGRYFFLEMNTRIQVEHTVTEMVTGIDLVQAQLRIAQGERLWLTQEQVSWRGHAIECRINAEDPQANFRPALGTIGAYREPSGFGVRVDSAAHAGYAIPPFYDSMIAKLVCWGANRAEAIGRMRRALADYQIENVTTTIGFHQLALAHPAFAAGDVTVNFIPRHLADALAALAPTIPSAAIEREAPAARTLDVEVNGKRFSVRISGDGLAGAVSAPQPVNPARRALPKRSTAATDGAVLSPIQGTVVAVKVAAGDRVDAGAVLLVVEAMKMENEVTAPRAGTVATVSASVGQSVEAGAALVTFAEG